MTETPYQIYVRFWGMVKSGSVLKSTDYTKPNPEGMGTDVYNEDEMLAASLAVEDVKRDMRIDSKTQVDERIKRLKATDKT